MLALEPVDRVFGGLSALGPPRTGLMTSRKVTGGSIPGGGAEESPHADVMMVMAIAARRGPMRTHRSHVVAAVLALNLGLLFAPAAGAHSPKASDFEVFADGLDGPEGLAFTRDGHLIVVGADGNVRSFAPDGTSTLVATIEDPIAGVTVLSDGRVLAASLVMGRVWAISTQGEVAVFAEGISGPNTIVESIRDGRIFVSASLQSTIVEITDGVPDVVLTAVRFPDGLAIAEERGRQYLYVGLRLDGEVVRYRMFADGTFGEEERYADGLFVSAIGFDSAGNLLAVGEDRVWVRHRTGEVEVLSNDPLMDGPSNLAFGPGRGFGSRDVYLTNYGKNFGQGTQVIKFRYNHRGAPLASTVRRRIETCASPVLPTSRTPIRGGAISCRQRTARRLPER